MSAKEFTKMVKNVVKKVTIRLTEEEKSAVTTMAKEENKSVQNFIYDRIMPGTKPAKMPTLKMTNWWQI